MQGNPFFRHFSRSTPTQKYYDRFSLQKEKEKGKIREGGNERKLFLFFFSTKDNARLRYCSAPESREFWLESIARPYFVENTFLTFMNHKSVLREQPVWVTRVLGNGRDTAGYKRAFIIREAVTLVLSIPTIWFFFLSLPRWALQLLRNLIITRRNV